MVKQKGHIMGVASMAAFLSLAGMVDYCTTKVGVLAFYEGLSQEIKHRFYCPYIKTSVVYPPWTRTRLIRAVENGLQRRGLTILEPEVVAEAMFKHILYGQSGQVFVGSPVAAAIRVLPAWIQELIRDWNSQIVNVHATTAVAGKETNTATEGATEQKSKT